LATSVATRKDGRLTVRIEQGGDSLTVRALGELDIATADTLAEELGWVWRCDAAPIVLDLGEVDFLDSVGLRALLAVAKHSRETENRVRIRQDSAAVRRVITVSGLEGALPLVES
jgi:anti-anti-sigma factor